MVKHQRNRKKIVIRKPIKKKSKNNFFEYKKPFKKFKKRYKKKFNFYTLDKSSYYARFRKQYRFNHKRYIVWFKKFIKYSPFKKTKYRKRFKRRFRYKFYSYGILKKKFKLKWIKRLVFRDLLKFKKLISFKFILAVSNRYSNRLKSKVFTKYFKTLKRNRSKKLFINRNLKSRFRKIKFRKLKKMKKRKNYKGVIVIFAETKNNFLVSCVNKDGDLIVHYNAGQLGFAGRTKVFPHTAFMCGKKMRFFLAENKVKKVTLLIKSKIRKKIKEAVRGFMSRRISIRQVLKRIPVTHNGIRAKKQKRK